MPSFLCNNSYNRNRVKVDNRNRHRKPLFSRLQNQNGIATPPLPLNAVVAQRGASVGIPHKYYWQRKSGGGDKKSSLLGRQASQTAFRLLLKTGEPVPLFGLQEKGWRQTASQFTSDGQCPPKYRDLQYLQIEVKIRKREKSWGQKKEKIQLLPIIREV